MPENTVEVASTPADTKDFNSWLNDVKITGFVKSSDLKEVNTMGYVKGTQTKQKAIRGSLLVATTEEEDYKVYFFVRQYRNDGNENKAYTELAKLLPEKCITIFSYRKLTPSANFQTASSAATKVYILASMSEYVHADGTSSRDLKGRFANVLTEDDLNGFVPGATFISDVYIAEMSEQTVDGKGTGRLVISGYLPKYKGEIIKSDFITPDKSYDANGPKYVAYIKSNFKVGDSVRLKGVLRNLQVISDEVGEATGFGSLSARKVKTFISEASISGGYKLTQTLTPDEVKDGLAARKLSIEKKLAAASASSERGVVVTDVPAAGAAEETPDAPADKDGGFGDFNFDDAQKAKAGDTGTDIRVADDPNDY